MKSYWLSLLAGTALLGGVGAASAAAPITLSASEPVMLSPADMDQITAGGYDRKQLSRHFKHMWVGKRFDRRHHRVSNAPAPATPTTTTTVDDITVNIGPGAVAIVQITVNGNNSIVDANVVRIDDINVNRFAKRK